MKKKVVISQSTVSAGQLEDFFRMIKDGTIGGEEVTAFLANPRKFSQGGLTVVRALNILGQVKVITAQQSANAWGRAISEATISYEAIIRYNEATLRECAKQNQHGVADWRADWRLVYCHGLSLREQREKRGADQSKQPCFHNNDWWIKPCEDSWAKYKPQPGYYLINLRGQFNNMNWNEQEQAISKLGREYERCHETVFAEAILTNYLVNNGERITEDWYHWGISAASYGYRVCVGFLVALGLFVDDDWHVNSLHFLRVALARKFDF